MKQNYHQPLSNPVFVNVTLLLRYLFSVIKGLHSHETKLSPTFVESFLRECYFTSPLFIFSYQRFNALKQKNPELRTLLAIGGWNAGSIPFSNLVADPVKRRNFAVHAADFLEEWGFDGLDLDWEYPAARGGIPDDKKNFILWIQVGISLVQGLIFVNY